MKLYNPILKGKYIKEIQMDIDKTIEVDDERGKELMGMYPYLVNMDDPKSKPSYIDIPKKEKDSELEKEEYEEPIVIELNKIIEKQVPIYDKRLDIIIDKLNKLMADKPKKKNIWHIIKSKIQSL